MNSIKILLLFQATWYVSGNTANAMFFLSSKASLSSGNDGSGGWVVAMVEVSRHLFVRKQGNVSIP